jgi:hypothetical protein
MRPIAFCVSMLILGCGGGGGTGTGGNGGSGGTGGGGGGGSAASADLAMSSASTDMAGGSSTSTDMAGGGSTTLCCGQPGDTGNELGVGQYCTGFNTGCTGMASLCSNISDSQLHFCTMVCQAGGNCGTGATCQCQNNQCGCFPDSCMNMPSTC